MQSEALAVIIVLVTGCAGSNGTASVQSKTSAEVEDCKAISCFECPEGCTSCSDAHLHDCGLYLPPGEEEQPAEGEMICEDADEKFCYPYEGPI
jgi:hypothetical protein